LIRKYLVCSRHLVLSSSRHDEPGSKVPIVELLLPIKEFWEVEELMKFIDYLVASNEDPILVNETMQKIFKKVAPYAVNEKDRTFLHGKASSST